MFLKTSKLKSLKAKVGAGSRTNPSANELVNYPLYNSVASLGLRGIKHLDLGKNFNTLLWINIWKVG